MQEQDTVQSEWVSLPRQKRITWEIGKIVLAAVSTISLLFLALPLLALLGRAIITFDPTRIPTSGIPNALFLSVVTTIITAIITLLMGTPLAYILARWKFPFKNLVNVLVELPIVLPPAVAGLALLVAFGRRGLLGPTFESLGITLPFTTAAVIVAQTFVSAPFYVRSAIVGIQGVPAEIEDAARVDGAAGFMLFWYVTLPMSRLALYAGLVLSWARALGEFGATILFAGSFQGRTQTMPLLVYNVLESNINAAMWTGLLLVAMALLALFVSQWLMRRSTVDRLD
jgi:molybdate transport system permease protein